MTLRSPRSEFVRKALLALAPAVLLLATAGSASASTKQETILQDDRLFGDPSRQFAAIEEADSLGVDTIHAVVVWDTIAPKNTSRTKPAGFNGATLSSYEPEKWDRFDDLVREADKRGIDILLSPSGPVPTWASTCKSPGKPKVCEPNAVEYQAFFAAVVKRYSGRTRDENQGGEILPKVDRFSVWNEPNLKGWLQPTSKNVSLYRNLFYAAQRGLAQGGQRNAQLLLGELAPLNGSLRFYQQLFCIDAAGKSLQGAAATKAGCKPGKRIAQLKATGVAHHPYARGGSPPLKAGGRDDITLRDIAKLTNVLKQGAKARAVKANLKIYMTEFGISSKPPAKKFGVSLTQQARELNHAEFAAYNNKQISSFAQFQLFDDPNLTSFQTGLKFQDGKAKPSFSAFRMPLYVTPKGNQVRVWGGVRPGAGQPVDIQSGSGSNFTTVKTVTVNGFGYIDETIAKPSGKIRLHWTSPTGEEFTSREASVDKLDPVAKR
jgi:hypothetical protein